MTNTILLALVAILLFAILVVSIRKSKFQEAGVQKLRQLIIEGMQSLFEDEVKAIATAYAEERKLIQWVEEAAKSGTLDVNSLAGDVEKRAYALAIKKAEDAYTLAESSLAKLRREIADQNAKLFELISRGYTQSADDTKKHLVALQNQEMYALRRLNDTRQELYNLTSMSTNPAIKTRK
ncbi:hypothetical protein IJI94_01385 [Candidatus Saccharibacteria bacterium]|nr:hypothetical protein [Candidatus Saccharibacteria bacterium]